MGFRLLRTAQRALPAVNSPEQSTKMKREKRRVAQAALFAILTAGSWCPSSSWGGSYFYSAAGGAKTSRTSVSGTTQQTPSTCSSSEQHTTSILKHNTAAVAEGGSTDTRTAVVHRYSAVYQCTTVKIVQVVHQYSTGSSSTVLYTYVHQYYTY